MNIVVGVVYQHQTCARMLAYIHSDAGIGMLWDFNWGFWFLHMFQFWYWFNFISPMVRMQLLICVCVCVCQTLCNLSIEIFNSKHTSTWIPYEGISSCSSSTRFVFIVSPHKLTFSSRSNFIPIKKCFSAVDASRCNWIESSGRMGGNSLMMTYSHCTQHIKRMTLAFGNSISN